MHCPEPSLHIANRQIHLFPAIVGWTYVGVEQTQDELEVRLLAGDERHVCGMSVGGLAILAILIVCRCRRA